MEVVADRRTQQPRPEAALAEDPVGALEDRDPGPRQRGRVGDDPVALGLEPEPVLDPAHHDRDDRAHPRRQAPPLHDAGARARLRLGGGDRLRHAERDGGVDVDAAVGRLLHHPDPDRGGRELDDDVRRQAVERGPLFSIRSGDRKYVGSVWTDKRPCRPADASTRFGATGLRAATSPRRSPRPDPLRSRPVLGSASARTRPRQWAGSFFQTSATIVGLAVAPTAPNGEVVLSLRTAHESFHMSVAVSCDGAPERSSIGKRGCGLARQCRHRSPPGVDPGVRVAWLDS